MRLDPELFEAAEQIRNENQARSLRVMQDMIEN